MRQPLTSVGALSIFFLLASCIEGRIGPNQSLVDFGASRSQVQSASDGAALPWPSTFKAEIYLKDFFWRRNATGYSFYNETAGIHLERFDYLDHATAHTGGGQISRYYNYSSMKQYTVDRPSGKCFWKHIISKPRKSTRAGGNGLQQQGFPPIPLHLAQYVKNQSLQLSNGTTVECYRYNVPLFGPDDRPVDSHFVNHNVTYLPYFVDQVTLLPVLIGTATLRVEFFGFETGSSSAVTPSDFELPSFIIPFFCQGPQTHQPEGTIGSLKFKAEAVPAMDPLLYPKALGYMGGDGGQATVLPSSSGVADGGQKGKERIYICADDWEVGFQWLGQKMGVFGIIHNMVILVERNTTLHPRHLSAQEGGFNVSYFTGSTQGKKYNEPTPFYRPEDESQGGYVWTNNALVLPAHQGHDKKTGRGDGGSSNRTMVMLTEKHVPGGKKNINVQLVVSNIEKSPTEWSYVFRSTPFGVDGVPESAGTQLFVPNSTNHIYILLTTHPGGFGRNFHMGRMTLDESIQGNFSNLEYYSESGGGGGGSDLGLWSHDPTSASTLFVSDAGCSTMFYHSRWKLFVALTISASGYVGLATASNITGPYDQVRKVYQMPPDLVQGYLGYCTDAHQSWLPKEMESDILLTYFTSTFSHKLRPQTSPNSYEANFVRIKLSK